VASRVAGEQRADRLAGAGLPQFGEQPGDRIREVDLAEPGRVAVQQPPGGAGLPGLPQFGQRCGRAAIAPLIAG
jgi:hypothetical protein